MHGTFERQVARVAAAASVILLCADAAAPAAARALPLETGKEIAARVEGEGITADELQAAIANSAAGRTVEDEGALESREEILKRLIDTKLIVQEARRIGLHELPEVRERIDLFSRVALREVLLRKGLGKIPVTDEELEPLYKSFVREYKIVSVIFEKEEDAGKLAEQLEAGGSFEALAAAAIEGGLAKGTTEATVVKPSKIAPEFHSALEKMSVGDTSPVVEVGGGFVIIKLDALLYPDDAEAKARAESMVRNQKQAHLMGAYVAGLRDKHVKVDDPLLDSLDFEAEEPGFEALAADTRVLAEYGDGDPLTIGDVANELRKEFHHGVERAIESQRVNSKRFRVVHELTGKKVMRMEALELGIDKGEEYLNEVKRLEEAVVFGVFIKKVAHSDVKLTAGDVKEYYEENLADYTAPEMIRLDCIGFENQKAAKEGLEKLQKGAEFSWLKINADGQVDTAETQLLDCQGRLVTTGDLEEGMSEALSQAAAGDYRVYSGPRDIHYLFHVQELIEAKAQPFGEVRDEITKLRYGAKLQAVIQDWASKLREASAVEVYGSGSGG